MSTSRDKIIETAMNLGIECGSLAEPSALVVKLSADRELRVSFSATGSITAARLHTSAGSVRLDGGVDAVRDVMRRSAFEAAEDGRRDHLSTPVVEPVVEPDLSQEKELLGAVMTGLAEKRTLPANPDAREVRTVADLDRWGGPASEVLEPVEPVVRTQEEIRASRTPIDASTATYADGSTDEEAQAGTLYPSCGAWALAKIQEKNLRGRVVRLVLFALAADADRGLHSPDGYNGTTLGRLIEITGAAGEFYRVCAQCDYLREEGLVFEAHNADDPDDEVSYRLPDRFLAYMRD